MDGIIDGHFISHLEQKLEKTHFSRVDSDTVDNLIKKEDAVIRVTPSQLDELLHPIVDANAEKTNKPIAKGLPAGPGGATGMIVFNANDAVEWAKKGKKVILVREETSPEII